jgi:nifR3 family TIM-barrel protein
LTNTDRLTANKLWLAPLAGYTDRAFRVLCASLGAEVMVSEMVSADGLIRDSGKTRQYVLFGDEERPFGIQLFGSDPVLMARAAEACLAEKPDFIDLNMGCPVRKVVKRGAGSALIKDPAQAAAIMKAVRGAVGDACPVSVKFRSGWDHDSLNYVEFGLALEAAGADFLCLHPRTQSQQFGGLANWEHISELKHRLTIPLIGNGDIRCPEDAVKMLAETGCDGIMIGRGALGKPWIFGQIRQFLASGDYTPINKSRLQETMHAHVRLAVQYKQERIAVKELRSQLCFYTKGLVGGSDLRQRINHAASAAELHDLIDRCETFRF